MKKLINNISSEKITLENMNNYDLIAYIKNIGQVYLQYGENPYLFDSIEVIDGFNKDFDGYIRMTNYDVEEFSSSYSDDVSQMATSQVCKIIPSEKGYIFVDIIDSVLSEEDVTTQLLNAYAASIRDYDMLYSELEIKQTKLTSAISFIKGSIMASEQKSPFKCMIQYNEVIAVTCTIDDILYSLGDVLNPTYVKFKNINELIKVLEDELVDMQIAKLNIITERNVAIDEYNKLINLDLENTRQNIENCLSKIQNITNSIDNIDSKINNEQME